MFRRLFLLLSSVPDPYVLIRILVFSSLDFKMPTMLQYCRIKVFLNVFLRVDERIRIRKIVTIPDPGGLKTYRFYGSESGSLLSRIFLSVPYIRPDFSLGAMGKILLTQYIHYFI